MGNISYPGSSDKTDRSLWDIWGQAEPCGFASRKIYNYMARHETTRSHSDKIAAAGTPDEFDGLICDHLSSNKITSKRMKGLRGLLVMLV